MANQTKTCLASSFMRPYGTEAEELPFGADVEYGDDPNEIAAAPLSRCKDGSEKAYM
jgi:hypothetical protein